MEWIMDWIVFGILAFWHLGFSIDRWRVDSVGIGRWTVSQQLSMVSGSACRAFWIWHLESTHVNPRHPTLPWQSQVEIVSQQSMAMDGLRETEGHSWSLVLPVPLHASLSAHLVCVMTS